MSGDDVVDQLFGFTTAAPPPTTRPPPLHPTAPPPTTRPPPLHPTAPPPTTQATTQPLLSNSNGEVLKKKEDAAHPLSHEGESGNRCGGGEPAMLAPRQDHKEETESKWKSDQTEKQNPATLPPSSRSSPPPPSVASAAVVPPLKKEKEKEKAADEVTETKRRQQIKMIINNLEEQVRALQRDKGELASANERLVERVRSLTGALGSLCPGHQLAAPHHHDAADLKEKDSIKKKFFHWVDEVKKDKPSQQEELKLLKEELMDARAKLAVLTDNGAEVSALAMNLQFLQENNRVSAELLRQEKAANEKLRQEIEAFGKVFGPAEALSDDAFERDMFPQEKKIEEARLVLSYRRAAEEAQAKSTELARQLEDERKAAERMRSELSEMEVKLKETEKQSEQFENERDHFIGANRTLTAQLERMVGALTEVQNTTSVSRVEFLEERIVQLESELLASQQTQKSLEAACSSSKQAAAEAGRLRAAEAKCAELEVQIELFENQEETITANEERIAALKTDMAKEAAARRALEGQLQRKAAQLEDSERAANAAKGSLARRLMAMTLKCLSLQDQLNSVFSSSAARRLSPPPEDATPPRSPYQQALDDGGDGTRESVTPVVSSAAGAVTPPAEAVSDFRKQQIADAVAKAVEQTEEKWRALLEQSQGEIASLKSAAAAAVAEAQRATEDAKILVDHEQKRAVVAKKQLQQTVRSLEQRVSQLEEELANAISQQRHRSESIDLSSGRFAASASAVVVPPTAAFAEGATSTDNFYVGGADANRDSDGLQLELDNEALQRRVASLKQEKWELSQKLQQSAALCIALEENCKAKEEIIESFIGAQALSQEWQAKAHSLAKAKKSGGGGAAEKKKDGESAMVRGTQAMLEEQLSYSLRLERDVAVLTEQVAHLYDKLAAVTPATVFAAQHSANTSTKTEEQEEDVGEGAEMDL